MKALYIKDSKTLEAGIPKDTKVVIFGWRPRITDYLTAKQGCKTLQKIYIAPSYMATTATASIEAAKSLGIEIIGAKLMHGHRTDLHGNMVEIDDIDNTVAPKTTPESRTASTKESRKWSGPKPTGSKKANKNK